MKHSFKRLLAGCLAAVITVSLLPVSARAHRTAPDCTHGTVEGFQADTIYRYQRAEWEELTAPILDPDTGEPLRHAPKTAGILQLVDSRGRVAAASKPTTAYYSREYEDPDTHQICWTYSVGEELEDTSGVTGGEYSLRLLAGGVTYPCLGRVRVVGEGELLLAGVDIEGEAGADEACARVALYGVRDPEELSRLTFTLETDDGVLARSTGAVGLVQDSESGRWTGNCQMKLTSGRVLEEDMECRVTADYSGPGLLVDGLGVVGRTVEASPEGPIRMDVYRPGFPCLHISDVHFEQAQNGVLSVELINLEPGRDYRLGIETGEGTLLYGSRTFRADRDTMTVDYPLRREGRVCDLADLEFQDTERYLRLREAREPEHGDRQWLLREEQVFVNPYEEGEEQTVVAPEVVPAGIKSLSLQIRYDKGCSMYTGAEDVVVLRDREGRELGRCGALTLEHGGGKQDPRQTAEGNGVVCGVIRGTVKVTDLKAGEPCDVFLNGARVGTIRVSDTMEAFECSLPMYDREKQEFWSNLGRFPVSFRAVNSSGSGCLVFRDESGRDVLTGEKLTGTPCENENMLAYCGLFGDLGALKDGAVYRLVFRDDDGRESPVGFGPMTYWAQEAPLDFADRNQFRVEGDRLRSGDQTLLVRLYPDRFRNSELSIFDEFRKMRVEDAAGEENRVVSCTENQLGHHRFREFVLCLEKPVQSGWLSLWHGERLVRRLNVRSRCGGEDRARVGDSCTAQEGRIGCSGLAAGGRFTGKLYRGYECLTPEGFTLTRRRDGDLYFSKAVLERLEAGDYYIRVFRDGQFLGDSRLTLRPSVVPLVVLRDAESGERTGGAPVLHSGQGAFTLAYMGAYSGGFLRWAESREELGQKPFVRYDSGTSYRHSFRGEDGPCTLYVELSRSGQKDDPQNRVIQVPLWLNRARDYGLAVPEAVCGVVDPEKQNIFTITATTALPENRVTVTFVDRSGGEREMPMEYAGPGEEPGRWQYRYDLDLAEGVRARASRMSAGDIRGIRITARSLEQNGGAVGSSVERFLCVGLPERVVLPEFGPDGEKTIGERDFTLRGYAAPDSTLSVQDGTGEAVTARADERGRFEVELTGLAPGSHVLTVTNPGGVGDRTVTLTVDCPDLQPGENPFEDVSEGDYFHAPVLWAVAHGVTAGINDHEFGPDLNCTRAQIVTFLWNQAGKPEPKAQASAFLDVDQKEWYFKPVMWAVEQDITAGIGGGKFGPEQSCTRAQAMTFLWKRLGRPASAVEVSFRDVTEDDWFYAPVQWAVEHRITSGVGDGAFGAEDTCLRAQIVTFLYRAMK